VNVETANFGMQVDHSNLASTSLTNQDDKPYRKWEWSRHVTHFKFLFP